MTPISHALGCARVSDGTSLAEASRNSPLLLVFLRHSGCAFSRETLADLAERRRAIEQEGARIVVVHMDEPDDFAALLNRFAMADVLHVSDPNQELYRAFDLARGSLWQVMGPKVIARGLRALFVGGIGRPRGDVFQLPGAFLVRDGEIVREFRHETSADRPDYCALSKS